MLEKLLLQNSENNMLHSSNSVDMKVYVLQLKQKSTAGVSNGILRSFRTATLENNFGGLLLKGNQRRRRTRSDPRRFMFSLFLGQLFIKSWNNVLSPQIFCITEPSNLDYVIHFHIPKKGLSSPVFTITILVVEIFGCY